MNELIKLTPQTLDNEQVNTVNARELHALLEVKSHYKDWFRNRVNKYGFQENIDYCCLAKTLATQTDTGRVGSSNYIDHYISLDMAKELSMVENNDKGREARRYFIECEKQLQQTLSSKDSLLLGILHADDDLSRAVAMNRYEVGYVRPLEQFKEQAQPKVTYHDLVLRSEGLMSITQIAKDFGMSGQKLNNILHEEGVQFKQGKQWLLYTDYQDKGYAKSETFLTASGLSVINTKWTQTGRLFIYELLKGKGILPVVEQTD